MSTGEGATARRNLFARSAVAVALLATVAGLWFSPLRQQLTIDNAWKLMGTVEGLWWGPGAFILVFAVFATLFVPATVFVVSGSLIWGWVAGGTYALAGATLGAFLSFLVGKWLGAGALRRFGRRGHEIADRLENAGFSTLLILRLIPIFPFAMLNYGAGFAGLRGRDFVAATALGAAPSIFIIAYSADAIVRGTLSGEAAFRRMLVAGVLLAALAIIPMLLRKRAGKALHLEAE